jgi:hypothetical protein
VPAPYGCTIDTDGNRAVVCRIKGPDSLAALLLGPLGVSPDELDAHLTAAAAAGGEGGDVEDSEGGGSWLFDVPSPRHKYPDRNPGLTENSLRF